jgi:ATP-binding cassette subfamily B protein
MIARHYGKYYTQESVKKLTRITYEGTTLLKLRKAAEKMGFKTLAAAITFEQLDKETPLPCIALWQQQHFVVIPPQNYSSTNPRHKIQIADPANGLLKIDKATFLESWIEKDSNQGVVLMLEPAASFYQ